MFVVATLIGRTQEGGECDLLYGHVAAKNTIFLNQ